MTEPSSGTDPVAAPEPPTERDLVITRRFDAPPALVFRAWTEREHLLRWCAPRDFTVTRAGGDPRPGGTWHSTMRAPDGAEYRVGGTYREVVPGERLVFTHAWEGEDGEPGHETLVTVTFAARGGGTEMTFRQGPFPSAASRDGHGEGWSETFDRLADHVRAPRATADREVVVTRVLHAPRALVFDAWTRPEHAAHWYGARGYTTPVCEMDVRPGGRFHFLMRSPSGAECRETGIFREVAAPERIVSVYTAAVDGHAGAELTTEVTFEALGGSTRVTVRQTFSDADFTRGAAEGTHQALDRLAAYLRRLHPTTTQETV